MLFFFSDRSNQSFAHQQPRRPSFPLPLSSPAPPHSYYRDGTRDRVEPQPQRLDGAALLARAEKAAAAAAAAAAAGAATADEGGVPSSASVPAAAPSANLDDLLLDAAGVRRLASALRKRSEANAVSRAKHAADPSAFLASELALDDAVRALQRVAPFPDLFPALLSTDAVESLVGLLSHENVDIAGAVLEVLQELTDAGGEDGDASEALAASAAALARSFVAAGGGAAAAERLPSFDEAVPEEAGFLFAGLSALLNMAELDEGAARSFVGAAAGGERASPTTAAAAATTMTKKLLPCLLRRVSSPPPSAAEFSSIVQTSSELVSTLAQAGTAGALAVVEAGGVDSLLRALARYRRRAPAPGSGDELEHVANLFDALCALLLRPEGREAFVEAEGVELMLLLIRKHGSGSGEKEGGAGGGEKSDAATAKLAAASSTALASSALRCLEFATTSGGGGGGGGGENSSSSPPSPSSSAAATAAAAAMRFVEGGGLGALFGGFMGRSRLGRGGGKKKRGGDDSGRRACLGLVANLLQCLDPEGGHRHGEGRRGEGGGEGGGGGGGGGATADPALSARVLGKFREAGFEKLDRLVELAAAASASLTAHDARVAAREKLRAEEEGRAGGGGGGGGGEMEDEEAARKLAARLAAGGDELQLCALAAAYCWSSFSAPSPSSQAASDNKAARAHFVRALHAKGMTLGDFRRALEERRAALGGGGGGGESAEDRRLRRLLSALGGGGGGGGGRAGGGEGNDSEKRPEKRARTWGKTLVN